MRARTRSAEAVGEGDGMNNYDTFTTINTEIDTVLSG
jgi:hypothetical protein